MASTTPRRITDTTAVPRVHPSHWKTKTPSGGGDDPLGELGMFGSRKSKSELLLDGSSEP